MAWKFVSKYLKFKILPSLKDTRGQTEQLENNLQNYLPNIFQIIKTRSNPKTQDDSTRSQLTRSSKSICHGNHNYTHPPSTQDFIKDYKLQNLDLATSIQIWCPYRRRLIPWSADRPWTSRRFLRRFMTRWRSLPELTDDDHHNHNVYTVTILTWFIGNLFIEIIFNESIQIKFNSINPP